LIDELSDERPATGAKLLDVGVAASVSKSFVAHFFMPLFDLTGIYPRIRVAEHDPLIRQLAGLELDVVLTDTVPGELEKLGLEQRTVHSSPMVAVAAPKLASRVRRFPEDLGSVPFLHHPVSSRSRLELDAFFRRCGAMPAPIGEVDDVTVLARAAIDGIAVVIVPETVIEEPLSRGALQVIAKIDDLDSRVHAFFHHRETPQRVIDAIDRLTQRARQIAA
jgi:LysR family transcriptional activator of nhaA